MLLNQKSVSHIVWTVLAFTFGIGVSYLAIKGGEVAFVKAYDKMQEFMNKTVIAKNIPIPPPTVEDLAANFGKPPDTQVAEKTVSIGFVGDIVPEIKTSDDIFSDIISYTRRPDIMIGNFEGVATSNIYFKCKFDSVNCFSFNGDNEFLKLLSLASFDVLNVANNHFNDYGQIGQEVTIKEIQKEGMVASGIKDAITYLTRNNLKIGIIGFSTYLWTTDMNNAVNLANLIKSADQNSDIVVVIFHGGGEGAKFAHTPNATEWYLGEDRGNVRSFAHSAIDAGADIVLGSGPHLLRGIEWYGDKLIAYSLGNFASASGLSTTGALKKSAMLEVTLRGDGTFLSGTISPFEIDAYGVPHPDSSDAGITAINGLSKEDFGNQGIMLSSSGSIIGR